MLLRQGGECVGDSLTSEADTETTAISPCVCIDCRVKPVGERISGIEEGLPMNVR